MAFSVYLWLGFLKVLISHWIFKKRQVSLMINWPEPVLIGKVGS